MNRYLFASLFCLMAFTLPVNAQLTEQKKQTPGLIPCVELCAPSATVLM